jgi:hypothetical protein
VAECHCRSCCCSYRLGEFVRLLLECVSSSVGSRLPTALSTRQGMFQELRETLLTWTGDLSCDVDLDQVNLKGSA